MSPRIFHPKQGSSAPEPATALVVGAPSAVEVPRAAPPDIAAFSSGPALRPAEVKSPIVGKTLGELGEFGIFKHLGRVWGQRLAMPNPEITWKEPLPLLESPRFLHQEHDLPPLAQSPASQISPIVCEPVRPDEVGLNELYAGAVLSEESRRILSPLGTRGVFQKLAEIISAAKPLYTARQLQELLRISPLGSELRRELLQLDYHDGMIPLYDPVLPRGLALRDLVKTHRAVHGQAYLTSAQAMWLYRNDERYNLHEKLANGLGVSPDDLAAFLREPTGPEVTPEKPQGFIGGNGVYSTGELLLAVAIQARRPVLKVLAEARTPHLTEQTALIADTARVRLGDNQAEPLLAALSALPPWDWYRGFE
jgi:hypothetical protein